MTEVIANMLQALEAAANESRDPPPAEAIIVFDPSILGVLGIHASKLTQPFWK